MKILLHTCCGPCTIFPVRVLREAGNDVAADLIEGTRLEAEDVVEIVVVAQGVDVLSSPPRGCRP